MSVVQFVDTVPETSISISELTNSTNTGVFDVMLLKLASTLQGEFNSGRITGAAYATAYTSCLNNFLDRATEYSLSKAKLGLELELLQSQLTGQNDDNAIKEYQLSTQMPAQLALTQAQTANQTKQTELLEYDLTYLEPQKLALAEQQVLTEQAQIAAIQAKTALDTYDLTVIEPQKLALLGEQIATEQAQANLYTQKIVTEKAQVDSSVIGANSVLDMSRQLISKQIDTFTRDSEQKAAKLVMDTWTVRANGDPTNPDMVNVTNKLQDTTIGLAVQKLLAGVGVTV